MKISHRIVTTAEGTLGELLAQPNCDIPTPPELAEVLGNLRSLAFIAEFSAPRPMSETVRRELENAARILKALEPIT